MVAVHSRPLALEAEAESVRVLRAQAGDNDALGELIEAHQQGVYRRALSIVRDPDEAQDVAQEVWIRVSRHLRGLQDPERFLPWLYRIVRNCSMDFCTRRSTRPRPFPVSGGEEDGVEFDPPDERDDGPERCVLSLDERRKVWQALGSLSECDRQALFLRETKGLPYVEIARALGVSIGAAEVRVSRARERFRRVYLEADASRTRCGVSPLQLASLVAGELAPALARGMSEHVEGCADCRERLRTMASGERLYRQLGVMAMPGLLPPLSVLGQVQAAWASLLAKAGSLLGSSTGGGTAAASAATAATAGGTAAGVAAASMAAPVLAPVAAPAALAVPAQAAAALLSLVLLAGAAVADPAPADPTPSASERAPSAAVAVAPATAAAAASLATPAALATPPVASAPPAQPAAVAAAGEHAERDQAGPTHGRDRDAAPAGESDETREGALDDGQAEEGAELAAPPAIPALAALATGRPALERAAPPERARADAPPGQAAPATSERGAPGAQAAAAAQAAQAPRAEPQPQQSAARAGGTPSASAQPHAAQAPAGAVGAAGAVARDPGPPAHAAAHGAKGSATDGATDAPLGELAESASMASTIEVEPAGNGEGASEMKEQHGTAAHGDEPGAHGRGRAEQAHEQTHEQRDPSGRADRPEPAGNARGHSK